MPCNANQVDIQMPISLANKPLSLATGSDLGKPEMDALVQRLAVPHFIGPSRSDIHRSLSKQCNASYIPMQNTFHWTIEKDLAMAYLSKDMVSHSLVPSQL